MQNFKLRTQVDSQKSDITISYNDKILFLGSCFSVEMAQKLKTLNYQVLTNPAGITFNPISILNTLKRIKLSHPLPEEEMILNNGLWCHHDFHGSFNNIDKQAFIENAQKSLFKAHAFTKEIKCVVLTLGTAFAFKQKSNNSIVNNCHKIDASNFDRILLSKREILDALISIKQTIDELSNHTTQFIVTLSPIRHIRDGLPQNQLSKATCLTAIHAFVGQFKEVEYFPSYEIILDDLRDYRFYKKDFIHPTDLAVEYIFDILEKTHLSSDESEIRKKVIKINNSLAHKAIHPKTEQHKLFLSRLKGDIEDLQSQFPWFTFN